MKNNITLHNDFENSEINYAVDKSGLTDTISFAKGGINSNIVENGSNISGGQKQRIAIARGLIRRPSLLILDEITSSLDSKTGYAIENNILDLGEVTAIVVTHKLNTELLKKYDEIIVMDKGEIKEVAPFNELVNHKGIFTELLSY